MNSLFDAPLLEILSQNAMICVKLKQCTKSMVGQCAHDGFQRVGGTPLYTASFEWWSSIVGIYLVVPSLVSIHLVKQYARYLFSFRKAL